MAQNINQNGNFHTPLSPMRFQSSMGKEVKRKYKDGKNMVRLSLARVVKVNYKYNTVDVISIQDKNNTTKNPNDNGKFSARLPIQFGGQTPDGKVYGSNTLVTVGSLVLIGYLEGHKDNPIVINIYGDADNQSMLTRTSFTGADESDEALQAELWQIFTLYPSMTYKNIDGHGNQEVTFPGKTFFYASADDSRVNDAFFDYDHLPSSSYANGDLIEPISSEAPNMLYVHQSLIDNHRVTFFVKSDGTVRVGSRHADGKGVTFWQLNTDGSFKIQQSNDTVDPEDVSSNFSSFAIEEDGTIALQAGDNLLTIGRNGLQLNGGGISGGSLDLSQNQTIIDMQGTITNIQKTTTTDGIVQTVTQSTPWHDINQQVGSKATTFIATPAPPYNVGDIWESGGKVYVCTVPKGFGATFAQSDWTLSGDVTSQNTAADTTNVNGQSASSVTSGISTAQSTANQAQTTAQAKSEMFLSQPTPPYNKGDVWNNNGVMYVANISRPDGATFLQADWVKGADVTANNTAADTSNVNGQSSSTLTSTVANNTTAASNAQSTANSKAKTFTATPVPPYNLGDMWNQSGKVYSCITPKAINGSFNAMDWVLVADMTSQNTSADTANVNGVASATVNSNISTAQSTANSANTLATSKAKAFITQPVPPYSVGDVWDNSSTVYICQTARSTGSFTASDWKLAGDVTANNTAADTTNVNGVASSTVNSNISTAQSTANSANSLAQSKAKGFVTQPVPPYSQGDVWDNGGTVYICTTARPSGSFTQSDWTLSGDVTANNTSADTAKVNGQTSSTLTSTVSSNTTAASNAQTTANSKAKTFTSTPVVPYNLGDIYKNGQTVYVCTTARSTGSYTASDFTLVGDVTSQNTSADTSNVNGVASATVNSNITAASTSASNAQTTANSKAKTFTTTPTTPYNLGDIYKNGQAVYVCTTARASGSYTASDFTLVGDVTANNTSADTSNVNGVASATVNSNITAANTAATNAQTSANNAQSTANSAQSLATSKAQGFLTQPTPPYNTGDVWENNGTVYICTTSKASGTIFSAADWTLSGDVTANNTSADTAHVNGVVSSTVNSNITSASTAASNAQTTANSKAQGFITQPVPPYNKGDVYNNGGTVYVCTTARASGSYTASDWTLAGDVTSNNTAHDTTNVNGVASSTVNSNITSASTAASNAQTSANNAQTSANNAQTTANSKAQTFTSTPAPPYNVGDIYKNGATVYVCTTAKASGTLYSAADFTLVGDVTSQNTAADTANVNGVASATVNSNITSASTAASNAQTSANNAQSTANTAQTTANSKAQTFTATPAPPYNVGDIYKNGSTVYVCTTAKASGGVYSASDFILVGDVTANNTSADTSKVNGVASSTVNSNITTAQNTANTAQTTANSKAQTFTATPTIPYNLGDIYRNGSTIYVCTTARSTGSYTASDFTLVGDVTANNTSSDTAHVNGVVSSTVNSNISTAQSTANTAQTTANSKAQTFTTTPAPPYNVGDIYKNGSTVYVCTTAKASGGTYVATDFTLVGDVTANNTAADTAKVNGQTSSTLTSTVSSNTTAASNAQTTANSKAKTWTAQPTPPYSLGDIYQTTNAVYICTLARSSGSYTASDWYLAGDVTSHNTAADTSAVNGVASATVNSNITAANTAASNAQATANSKAKTWTSQPVPPYSSGDIYQATNAVYVCTSSRASGSYTASDWYLVGDVTAHNTAADVTNVNGTPASTVISNISTAQSTANTAQSSVNNLQVGGRNYLLNSTFSQGFSFWSNSGFVRDTSSPDGANVKVVGTLTNTQYIFQTANPSQFVELTNAKNFVMSADISLSNYVAGTTNPYLAFYLEVVYSDSSVGYFGYDLSAYNGKGWNRVNYSFSTSATLSITQVKAYIYARDFTGTLLADNVKLEIGNKPTTWTPAPEDVTAYTNTKAQTFTSTPVPPYNVGDIYKNGTAVYVCTTAKATGGTYATGDFVLASDVTANNTSADTSAVNGVASATVNSNISSANTAATNAQNTANSKAKTYTAQPAPPYNTGDVWQSTNAIYICTAGRASGSYTASDWYKAGDVTSANTANDTSNVNGVASATVNSNITAASNSASNAQTTANSKAKTYTAQPAPPYNTGDVWQTTNAIYICTAGRASGSYTATDWYKAGDVTSANTAADTTNVNGQASSTLTSTVSSNTTAANNAQTTANSKAKTWTAQPTPPYSTGDIWQNGGSVYVCTAGRASGSYTASDWYKAGDVTSANTAADTTNVNGTPASTVISNINSATTNANSAQSSANTALALTYDAGFTQGLAFWSSSDTNSSPGTAITDANVTVVSGQGVTGGNVVQVVGSSTSWLYSKYAYAVDTTHTYKVRFRVKQTVDPTTGGAAVYAGVATYDATGALQTTSPGTHRYCAASGVTIHVADGWKYFEGTITGTGNSTANQFRPGTAYVKPMCIINYNGGNGTAQIDMIDFEDITTQTAAQSYSDTNLNGLVIGARNYLRSTSNFDAAMTNWSMNNGSAIVATLNPVTDSVYGTVLDYVVTTNSTTAGSNLISLQNSNITLPSGKFTVGNTYTVSFLMKNDLAMTVGFMDANGTNPVAAQSAVIPVTTSWTRMVYTFQATATGNVPVFYLSASDTTHTGHIQITQVQLEDGPKASGYHMAPEDVVNGISTAQSSINSVTGGTFTTDMGNEIVSTVTNATTYQSNLAAKADASDLANYATGDQLSQAQSSANSYTDQQIAGIDFSPYVTSASMTQSNQAITQQFTASGGVNLLKNSVGHAVDPTSKLPTFWNVVSGTPTITLDPTIAHYGATSGFMLNGSTINQTVTVTPGVTYTVSAIVNKGTAGTGYIKMSDTSSPAITQTFNLVANTAYTYQKVSIDVTPATSSLIIEISGDSTSGGVMFTCVMLNVGTTAFTWQQAVGEVYNTNVNFDLNGIRVMATDSTGRQTSETVMSPTQFAGYTDLNGDGVIDTSIGSADEVFRMDTDTFVMRNAAIGPVKIVQTTGTHTGIAFIANA